MYCDTSVKIISEFPLGSCVQTFVFDLIAGIIATGFMYRFQQGIEISHPIYSIIFSNIAVTTAVSFITFIFNMIEIYIKPCSVIFLLTLLNSSSILINNVSLMIIAFLRYHILVTVKKYTDGQEMDLMKIRKFALIANWLLIIIILVTRGFFFHLIAINKENTPWAVSFTVVITVLLLITTLTVYYKMDVGLKLIQNIPDIEVKDATIDIGEEQNSVLSESSHMENVNTAKENQSCHPNESGRSCDKKRITRLSLNTLSNFTTVECCTNNLESNILRNESNVLHPTMEEENRYGGIYIGEVIKPNRIQYDSKEKKTSSKKVVDRLNEIVKSSEQNILVVEHKNSRLIPSNIVLVNPFDCTTNQRSPKIHDKSIQPEQTYQPLDNESVLPNQVFCEENTTDIVVPTSNETLKSYHIRGAKSNFLDTDAISNVNNENIVKVQHQQKKSSDDRDLDRISVIDECISSAALQKVNITTETKDLHKTTKDYNDSKEHKSIKKSSLICLVYLLFVFIAVIFIYISIKKQKPNFFLLFLIMIGQKLYRTFATILTSIYCFELVQTLFSQIIYDIIFHSRGFYIRIREAI